VEQGAHASVSVELRFFYELLKGDRLYFLGACHLLFQTVKNQSLDIVPQLFWSNQLVVVKAIPPEQSVLKSHCNWQDRELFWLNQW